MKRKLTLSIDEDKINKMKKYAKQNDTSISKIVEEHFEQLITKSRRKKLDINKLRGILGKAPKNFDWKKEKLEYLMKKYI